MEYGKYQIRVAAVAAGDEQTGQVLYCGWCCWLFWL